ncbi:MAG: glycosyltransferase [Candidatus Dormibacteria bacterium]
MRISYALAVHDDATRVESGVGRLMERLGPFPGSEVILVENGSSDASLPVAREVAARLATDEVAVRVETVPQGLGNAFRRGLRMARGDLVVMCGVDLPFGFTDLDQWLALKSPPSLVLGSKSHPRSRLGVSTGRRVMSLGFRVARRLILGIAAGDTQGSLLIAGSLAHRIEPRLRCKDYLVTTEIVAWAIHLGVRPLELPVVYPGSTSSSTVRPVRDTVGMLVGMLALRGRLRRVAPGERSLTPSEQIR